MKKLVVLFSLFVVVSLVALALALPAAAKQKFLLMTHYDQGPHGQINTWTRCMPDDAWIHQGHSGHVNRPGVPDDVLGGECKGPEDPEPTSPVPPGVTPPPSPTEAPCVGDSCGGIAFSGVNFQPGRVPTEPGTVYVTDAGGLGGKVFFSYHFQAGEQWSDWIEFPLQFGVSGDNLEAWWMPDSGGQIFSGLLVVGESQTVFKAPLIQFV